MKITGLTIIRNAIKNDYPVVESITSILPVVDEMIVSVDKGEDETLQLIQSIPSGKIRIVFSEWDMSLRQVARYLPLKQIMRCNMFRPILIGCFIFRPTKWFKKNTTP